MFDCPFKKDTEKSHDSAQYDTALNLTPGSMKHSKNETILTHWSMAQAGSNDDKKLGVENLVGLSL